MRVAFGLEYNGSRYHGWQRQANQQDTLQQLVEQALSRVADGQTNCVCAGRTDAKVHATAQVIHIDTEVYRSELAWVRGVNHYLPRDIRITWAQPVDDRFHARFSAISRSYRYIIDNRPIHCAFNDTQVTWHPHPLNVEAMTQAAQVLLGEHDFSAFRSSQCQAKNPVRVMKALRVSRYEHFVVLDFQANAFLHHMVRNIVGALLEIGENKQPSSWMEHLLLTKNRQLSADTARPQGLYLTDVEYGAPWTVFKKARYQPLANA